MTKPRKHNQEDKAPAPNDNTPEAAPSIVDSADDSADDSGDDSAERPPPFSALPPPPETGSVSTLEGGIPPLEDHDDDWLQMTPESWSDVPSEDDMELDVSVELPSRPAVIIPSTPGPGGISNTSGAHRMDGILPPRGEGVNGASVRGAHYVDGPGNPPPPDEEEVEVQSEWTPSRFDTPPVLSAVVGWVQHLVSNAPLVEGIAIRDEEASRVGGNIHRYSYQIFAATIVFIAAIAGAMVGLGVWKRKPDAAPADASPKFQELLHLARTVSEEEALSDLASPQFAALSWMANEDKLSLSPKEDPEAMIQRYIMVVLYFSTDGENWIVRLMSDDGDSWFETSPSESASWLCRGWGYACWDSFESIEMERSGGRPYLSKDMHECDWEGVGCYEGTDIVGAISMVGNNLGGKFPQEIAALDLKYLHLTLSTGQMGGSLEPLRSLGGSIKEIALSFNNLTGTIPDIFDALPNLTHFVCEMNRLTGSIPKTIIGHNSLKRFSAGFNGIFGPGLSGTIPIDFSTMPSLEHLFLTRNSLSGPIPPSISNWANPVTLGMAFNLLTGTIPESIGRLTKLKSLGLSFNDLTGTIPSDLFNFQELYGLMLGTNALTGTIPENAGNASSLQWLTLENNGLTGKIPVSVGDLENLFAFSAHNNHLNGTIPPAMGSIQSMRYLQLRNNELEGTLPETFKDAIHLEELHLAQNQLTGSMNFLCDLKIPTMYADCGGDDAEIDCECCQFCCSDKEDLAECNDNPAWSKLFGMKYCAVEGKTTFLCGGNNPPNP